MENLSGRLTLFHNLYLGCLACLAVCLAIAVLLFIRLDIRNVIAFLTGHEAKREIRHIRESSGEKRQKKEEKTTLLNQELPDFRVEREILMIHTDEIIA